MLCLSLFHCFGLVMFGLYWFSFDITRFFSCISLHLAILPIGNIAKCKLMHTSRVCL